MTIGSVKDLPNPVRKRLRTVRTHKLQRRSNFGKVKTMTKTIQYNERTNDLMLRLSDTLNETSAVVYKQQAIYYLLCDVNGFEKKDCNKYIREHINGFAKNTGVLSKISTAAFEAMQTGQFAHLIDWTKSLDDNIRNLANGMAESHFTYTETETFKQNKQKAEERKKAQEVEEERLNEERAVRAAEYAAKPNDQKVLEFITQVLGIVKGSELQTISESLAKYTAKVLQIEEANRKYQAELSIIKDEIRTAVAKECEEDENLSFAKLINERAVALYEERHSAAKAKRKAV